MLNNGTYHHLLGYFPINLRLFPTFSDYNNTLMNTLNYFGKHILINTNIPVGLDYEHGTPEPKDILILNFGR